MTLFEELTKIAVKRGFFWQSAENYGGVSGFYDYGPLGSKVKQKIIACWRKIYAQYEEFIEIETPSITPHEVFRASGHIDHFTDAIVTCKKCRNDFRADELIKNTIHKNVEGIGAKELEDIIEKNNIKCPECNSELNSVDFFNLMFETKIGPGKGRVGYLRPETAQGIFIAFNRLYRLAKKKLPFGAIQIGKGYRNEISPRQGMIRLREFTMMEAEIFLDPNEKTFSKTKNVENAEINVYLASDQKKENEVIKKIKIKDLINKNLVPNEVFAYYLVKTKEFLNSIGISDADIRFRQQLDEERAHYSAETYDAEVKSDQFGWIEVAGHAYRTTYDLTRHDKYSSTDMKAFIKFDTPKKVKETQIKPNAALIGKTFKKDSKKILDAIQSMANNKIIDKLNKNELIIEGHKIEKDMIEIKEIESTKDGQNIIPAVYEPSYGLDRCLYLALEKNLIQEKDRTYLKLAKKIAPIAFGVFPIVAKSEFTKIAKEIYEKIKSCGYNVIIEDKSSIGRRYAKADEIGVPYSVTIDKDTQENKTITIRERDSKKQVLLPIAKFYENIDALYHDKIKFDTIGKIIS